MRDMDTNFKGEYNERLLSCVSYGMDTFHDEDYTQTNRQTNEDDLDNSRA